MMTLDDTPNRTLVQINMDAEDRVLANVEAYTEWESSHCMHATMVVLGYIPTQADMFAAYIETATIPHLVALKLYPAANIAGAACLELRERYLNECSTQRYLTRVASEVAAGVQE